MDDIVDSLGLDRLIIFSDGVFAIAITLLALDLHVPRVPEPVSPAALRHALVAEIPRFTTFVISFEVVGIFWLVHHRLFRMVRRFDPVLALLNLLFLLFIVILPFSTTLIGEYGNTSTAAVWYSGTLVAASLASLVTWIYVARGGQRLRAGVDPTDVRAFSVRGALTLGLFAASMLVAVWSPGSAQLTWVVVAIVGPASERWTRRPRNSAVPGRHEKQPRRYRGSHQ